MSGAAALLAQTSPLNEEQRSLLSLLDAAADNVTVIDTGSVDDSVEIEQKYADVWELYLGCNDPGTGLIADFADARNRSFDIATGDWVLWLNPDEEVVSFSPQQVRAALAMVIAVCTTTIKCTAMAGKFFCNLSRVYHKSSLV